MPSILKALIVVFTVSSAMLFFYQRPFTQILGQRRYLNWAVMWLAFTVCGFVIGNFWIFAAVSFLLIFFLSRSEPVKPAVFAFLLAALPPYSFAIPGFAGINKFIEINPQLVIVFAVMLPLMFFSKSVKKLTKEGTVTDLFVFLFLVLQIILAFRAPTFTHGLRLGIQVFLAIAPIYYVFSRYPRSFEDVRIIAAAFVLPMIVLSGISLAEFAMRWHFYNHIASVWDVNLPHGYKLREGLLRASTSTHNSIAWGFISMCGFGVALAALNDRMPKLFRNVGLALLLAGLVISLSRGPWVGAGVIAVVFVLTSPRAISRTSQLAAGAVVAFLVSLATPFGRQIIDLLPFIGGSGEDTISYRQRLLEASWDVILENPLFGAEDYLSHPKLEALRQGEDIIDIVNTYAQVALGSGFVGVALFIGAFVSAVFVVRKAMVQARAYNKTLALYCQAYLATLIGVMFTIFTTSSIEPIPTVYWLLIGGAVGVARVEALERQSKASVAETAAEPVAAAGRPAFDWK